MARGTHILEGFGLKRLFDRLLAGSASRGTPGGHAPDTKKAKIASYPGTRQKPSLDAPFGLFWVPEAPGTLFDQIQAQILGLLCLQRSRRFRLKATFRQTP